jgi:hypothetical protein
LFDVRISPALIRAVRNCLPVMMFDMDQPPFICGRQIGPRGARRSGRINGGRSVRLLGSVGVQDWRLANAKAALVFQASYPRASNQPPDPGTLRL